MKHVQLASLAFALFLSGTSAYAQATRTWVSGVGDDVNPCSRTAPCKTFAGAISKTASGGEINVIDAGGFGAVTITKPITIDGGGSFASILSSGVNAITINIAAQTPPPNVVLRNLSINGAGTTLGLNGVNVLSAANLVVENVQMSNFSQQGIKFTPSNASFASKLVVKDTTINNAAGGAITVAPTGGGLVNGQLINVTASLSAHGLRVQERGLIDAIDSHFVDNTGPGVSVIAPNAGIFGAVNLKDSVTSGNQTGAVTSGPSALISLSNVSILLNGTGLSAPSGAIVSFSNNQNLSNGVAGAPTLVQAQQ